MKLRLKKSHYIIIGIYAAILAIAGYIFFLATYHPGNLGSRLEYIGKDDYGCLVFCASPPFTSEYYFATDMSEEEVKTYFKNARYEASPNIGGAAGGVSKSSRLAFLTEGKEIVIYYYDNPKAVIRAFELKDIGKPNVISIGEFDYDLARKGLGN